MGHRDTRLNAAPVGMPQAHGVDDIAARASSARAFLETIWPEWHAAYGRLVPAPLSRGTCGRSSLFLMRVLMRVLMCAGYDAVQVCGTFGGVPHAWVACHGYVVDITADQFGLAPVLVTRPDSRFRSGRDRADPAFVTARRRAVAALWGLWCAHQGKR